MGTYQPYGIELVLRRVYIVKTVSHQWSVFEMTGLDLTKIATTLPKGVEIKLLKVLGSNSKDALFEILTGDLAGNYAVIHLPQISGVLLERKV